MDQTTLRYDQLIESHIDHLRCKYRDLLIDDGTLPQFWFLTVTFLPVEAKRDIPFPIPPHRCFVFFERFYVRLISRLMNNFERKRSLQPLTYVYIDYPFTKREKTYATLSLMDQFKANPYRFYSEHPETTPHIHSVMLISPTLVDRFKKIAPELELLFQKMGPANRTLHCAPLQTPDELRDVIFYSSKLLKQPSSVLRGLSKRYRMPPKQPDSPQRSVCDIDLYTVLPKAKSEPIYVKAK